MVLGRAIRQIAATLNEAEPGLGQRMRACLIAICCERRCNVASQSDFISDSKPEYRQRPILSQHFPKRIARCPRI